MAPAEQSNHKHDGSSALSDGEKQKKNLDQEVTELISALTKKLATIQTHKKYSASGSSNQEDDDAGVGIITLAGSNVGATMRGEIQDEKPAGLPVHVLGLQPECHEDFTTYVNSNFQAVNNSILLGGSYNTNDPGVHLDISDYNVDPMSTTAQPPKHGKKKGAKKNISNKGTFKSDDDHHTHHHSDD